MQPPQNPYGQQPQFNPQGGPPFQQPAPAGTSSPTTLIVTGVLGIICCGFLAPYTWIKSNQALQSIRAGLGNAADAGTYNTARIIGIIGTALWILAVIGRIAGLGQTISTINNNPRNGTGTTTLPANP